MMSKKHKKVSHSADSFNAVVVEIFIAINYMHIKGIPHLAPFTNFYSIFYCQR